MKNILVAMGFSNKAYCALFYATQLLKSKHCTFYPLNTFNELTLLQGKVVPSFAGKKVINQLQTESEERLAREPVIKDLRTYSDVPFLELPDKSEIL